MRDSLPSDADIPPPLHIIKRGKSMQVLHSSPRKISSESADDGPDLPLTVVKNRNSQSRAGGRENWASIDQQVVGQGFRERSQNIIMDRASVKARDPITPNPRKVPASRRPSSLRIGRTLSPSFLKRLRSLSGRKALSSKTSKRQYDSRAPSGSSDGSIFESSECATAGSWDQFPKSYFLEPSIDPKGFEANGFDGYTSQTTAGLGTVAPDPYLLIPHVSITPESKSLNEGQLNIWAAIEISGRLVHPRTGNSAQDPGQTPFMPLHHYDDGSSRYGYLYDVKVDILPIAGGSVVDLIGDTAIRKINPGSNFLILAHIRLGVSENRKPSAPRHDSDSLIADLELQLGNAQTECLRARIHYCHSGFPACGGTLADDGVSAYETRLETVATGTAKRYNPTSTWSPRPTPTANPLFAIVASHWGPSRANEVMRRVVSNKSSTHRAADWIGVPRHDKNEDTVKAPDRTGTAPPVPQRQASLGRLSQERMSDPARKIWTELRQTSSGTNRPAFHVSKADRLPAATTFVDAPDPRSTIRPESARPESKLEVRRQREILRETAARNRRSIGSESLKSLVPSVVDTSIEGSERSIPNSPSPPAKQESQLEGRKRGGRWSLGNWW